MNKLLMFAALSLSSISAHAQCFGTNSFSNCYDNSGNNYTVNRMGSSTYMNGYNSNTGSSWNQNTNTMGNMTTINGHDANGNSWNGTITNMGNGYRTINGTDSNGNSYSKYCTPYGCN